jgi:hypothetical protein
MPRGSVALKGKLGYNVVQSCSTGQGVEALDLCTLDLGCVSLVEHEKEEEGGVQVLLPGLLGLGSGRGAKKERDWEMLLLLGGEWAERNNNVAFRVSN